MEDGYTNFRNYSTEQFAFPKLPRKKLDFTNLIIHNIPDSPYSFLPYQYWLEIYRSLAKRLYLLMARQLFKTTFFAFSSAHVATTKKRSTTTYIAPDEDKLSTYADQKYRAELLDQSPLLRSLVTGSAYGLPGRRSKVQWRNGSFNWQITDEGGYRKQEGKSADLSIYDEIQEHDLTALSKAKESMTKKIGDEYFGGVGGEYGSEQERLWLSTTQAEWHYNNEKDYTDLSGRVWKDQGWRKDLQYGMHEDEYGDRVDGLIYAPYMEDVCKGYWEHTHLENGMFPGYHLSQLSACHVPLAMKDAIELYHIPPEYSLEWKELNYPRIMTIAHAHGKFYKAPRKPITRADALACLEPYRYLYFMNPEDIIDFKQTFPGRILMLMGIDWGSGNAGAGETVITIMMKWKGINEAGQFSADRDRYFIVYQERLPYEMSEDMSEAFYAVELFKRFYCDFGVGDLGYGEKQVNAIIMGGVDPRTREWVDGLSFSKFIGAWTRGKPTKVVEDKPPKFDEEGTEEVSHILLDHTRFIEDFVDMVKWKVPHPGYFDEEPEVQERFSRRKLGIPYGDQWKTEQLINDMTAIERTDIEVDFLTAKPITTEKAKKKFAHPPDSVVSMANCFVADGHFGKTGTFLGSFTTTRRKPGGRPTVGGTGSFKGTRR